MIQNAPEWGEVAEAAQAKKADSAPAENYVADEAKRIVGRRAPGRVRRPRGQFRGHRAVLDGLPAQHRPRRDANRAGREPDDAALEGGADLLVA